MPREVVYLDEEEAEHKFVQSGQMEFIFEGWYVFDDSKPWGKKYNGPYETKEEAEEQLDG